MRRRNAANRDARLAWLTVQIWAVTKSKNRMPALEGYLLKPAELRREEAAAAKARRHLAAVQVLSAQFGGSIRRGGDPVNGK